MLAPALAGCSLAPSGPAPESYPTTDPNLLTSFDWNADRSTLTVTFDRGNRLTAENTDRLAVVTDGGDGGETVWVGPDEADPVASFPLTPGATVTHELSPPATTLLLWTPPGPPSAELVATWRPETGVTGE